MTGGNIGASQSCNQGTIKMERQKDSLDFSDICATMNHKFSSNTFSLSPDEETPSAQA